MIFIVDLVLLLVCWCIGDDVMWVIFYFFVKFWNFWFMNCGFLLDMIIFGILNWVNCFLSKVIILEFVKDVSKLILMKLEK